MSTVSRVVLVTAGGSGIGLAIAKYFVKQGDEVHICDVDQLAIDKALTELPTMTATCAELTKVDEVDTVFDDLQKTHGKLDILVNNVGVAGPTAAVEDILPQEWNDTIGVDLNSIFYVTRKAVPLLKKSKGVMINMSSNAGLFGCPLRSPYAAAKWAIVGLTKTWAMELGPFGVRVNALCPGSVNGDRIDQVIEADALRQGKSTEEIKELYVKQVSMKTFVEPEDVAHLALFLTSDYGRYVSGQAIGLDGHTEGLSNN